MEVVDERDREFRANRGASARAAQGRLLAHVRQLPCRPPGGLPPDDHPAAHRRRGLGRARSHAL